MWGGLVNVERFQFARPAAFALCTGQRVMPLCSAASHHLYAHCVE